MTVGSQGSGFVCAACGAATGVIDSRPTRIGMMPGIRRRRSCDCGVRFTTFEFATETATLAGAKMRSIRNGFAVATVRGLRAQLVAALELMDSSLRVIEFEDEPE